MNFKSLIEITEYFSEEEKCVNYLIEKRWKGTITCPNCSCSKIYELKGKFKRYKCTGCKKQFSVTKGTIFESSSIPLRKWFIAIFLYAFHKKGISSCQLAKDIGVTQKTAWFMSHRIRHMLNTGSMELTPDIIEVDETFVGGKNKNRPWHKKVKNSQGRSFKDKTPVFGILQREKSHTFVRPHKVIPGKTVTEKVITKKSEINCFVVRDTKAKSIQPIIRDNIPKETVIVSDEWQAYRGLENEYQHEVVDHSRKQYMSENGFTTNTLEGAWSHLKRTIIGTYHQVSRKHLQKYCDEFAYRYNTRRVTVREILNDAMKNVNCRLTYKDLIEKPYNDIAIRV
jgi:transposase-like protein